MAKEKSDIRNSINPGDLGEQLQEYRHSAGYTLDQMAEALCLSEEILTDLEDEKFDKIPAAPYVRGYLRSYAKLAERDSAPLVSTYESLRGADPEELNSLLKKPTTSITPSNRSLLPILAQLFFFALLIAVVIGISKIPDVNKWMTDTWNSFSTQSSSQQEARSVDKPLLTGTMPIPTPLLDEDENKSRIKTTKNEALAIQAKKESPILDSSDSASNETAPSQETIKETNTQPETVVEIKAKENISEIIKSVSNNEIIESLNEKIQTTALASSPEKTPTEPKTVLDDKINIKLVFNKEVWVRIRGKDKKTLFEGLSYKGDEKILNLNKPLTFRVGNAQGLSLFVDNKAVDISNFIKGSIANFTLQQ